MQSAFRRPHNDSAGFALRAAGRTFNHHPLVRMPQPAPQSLPDDSAELAVFLDVDGTLLPIAARPADVAPDPQVGALLQRLSNMLGGAVALVSGRSISALDRLFAPYHFAAAGQHGAEWRGNSGTLQQMSAHFEELEELRVRMRVLAAQDPRLLLEDKGLSVALHYRAAPGRAQELEFALQAAVEDFPALALQRGKCVLEIRPAGCGKDVAIRRLLSLPAFAGRTPLFAGDDATDEDGFRLVNALGGISIKIGTGASNAHYRLDGPAELRDWLTALAKPRVHVTVLP